MYVFLFYSGNQQKSLIFKWRNICLGKEGGPCTISELKAHISSSGCCLLVQVIYENDLSLFLEHPIPYVLLERPEISTHKKFPLVKSHLNGKRI